MGRIGISLKIAPAGVIPTNAAHCVFAAVPAQRFPATFRGDVMRGFLQVLEASCPRLCADVERGSLVGRLRGFSGAQSYLRQCHGAGWALVGDAGYFKDPLTAHGITDALRDAELLSRAVAIGSAQALEEYQRERDALSLPFLRITDAIASFSWDLRRGQAASCGFECLHEGGNQSRGRACLNCHRLQRRRS